MTGIQIPPGLVPNQLPDAQLTRPALAIDKLAALMPVPEVTQGDVQSSTGETVQARQPVTVTPGAGDPRAAAQNGSTRETLSFAARAILDLFEGGDAQPLRTSAPLLSAPPASGANTANGANGAAATLSAALATLVDQSGMFYESHLLQWATGQRPLSTLLQEPQATLRVPAQALPPASGAPAQPGASVGAPVALLPYGGPAASATPPPSATILAELTRPTIFPLTTGVPAQPAQPQREAQASAQQGSAAGQQGAAQTPAAEQRRAAHASAAAHAYQVTAEVSHDGHHIAQAQRAAIIASWNSPDAPSARPQADAGPPVHPGSEGVVRQQLELLATQQFRCTVDAWPGLPVDWEVTREQQRDGSAGAADAVNWSTRLRLSLPRLGNVDAVLTLGAHGLEARLVAADATAAAQLARGQVDFRSQLDARGIALLNLNVSTADEASVAAGVAMELPT